MKSLSPLFYRHFLHHQKTPAGSKAPPRLRVGAIQSLLPLWGRPTQTLLPLWGRPGGGSGSGRHPGSTDSRPGSALPRWHALHGRLSVSLATRAITVSVPKHIVKTSCALHTDNRPNKLFTISEHPTADCRCYPVQSSAKCVRNLAIPATTMFRLSNSSGTICTHSRSEWRQSQHRARGGALSISADRVTNFYKKMANCRVHEMHRGVG